MCCIRSICILAFGCWLLIFVDSTNSAEKTDPLIVKILSDWNARQKIANSMLYEIGGHFIVPRNSYPEYPEIPGDTPINDSEYDVSIKLLLDFRKNRAHRTRNGEELCGPIRSFIPFYEVNLYDGQHFFNYRPHTKNTSDRWMPSKYQTELDMCGSKMPYLFFRPIDLPIFFSHGSVPAPDFSLTPRKMLGTPEAAIFAKQSLIQYKGRQCVFLRTLPLYSRGRRYYEMTVDPARDSAIMRYSCFIDKKLFSEIEIEHVQTEFGWFPTKWTRSSLENPKSQPITLKAYIKRRVYNPQLKDSDFKIEITPGMVIYDRKTNTELIADRPGKPMIPLKEWMSKHPDK